VDATSKELPDGSMEFTYSIGSLPQGLIVDVAVPILGNGLRPDIDLAVNGAPVKMDPGTEVAAVQLARDAATKITATARRPAPAAPNAETKP
jgi:F420-dependent methylenetetrahydromethanopterin dehydrogenase